MTQAPALPEEDEMRKHLAGLFEKVDSLLDEKKLSKEFIEKTHADLAEILEIEMVNRITDRFSKEESKSFFEALKTGDGALEEMLKSKFTEEERSLLLVKSTESVLEEFTQKLRAFA